MTKHLPMLLLLAGLALVAWRPEWTSVATLAILTLSAGGWAFWTSQQQLSSAYGEVLVMRTRMETAQRETSERLAALENKLQRAMEANERPSAASRARL